MAQGRETLDSSSKLDTHILCSQGTTLQLIQCRTSSVLVERSHMCELYSNEDIVYVHVHMYITCTKTFGKLLWV